MGDGTKDRVEVGERGRSRVERGFSRRHPDLGPHRQASANYAACDSRSVRQARARALEQERAARTDAQQLALLDESLGVGVGAIRERARLKARIAASAV